MPSTFLLQWAWRAAVPWGSPVLSLANAACSILRTSLTTPGKLALIAPTLWHMVEDSSLLEALYPTPFGYHWCELKFVPTFHSQKSICSQLCLSPRSPPLPPCCVCAHSFVSSTLFQLSSAILFCSGCLAGETISSLYSQIKWSSGVRLELLSYICTMALIRTLAKRLFSQRQAVG